jgi:cytochrome c oxidase cbb3-type subunit 1
MGLTGAQLDQRTDQDVVRLVFAYLACATIWLLVGTGIGFYVALKFVWPDLGVASFLSEPRLRPVHTNLVLFGWASLAQIAMALLVVPRTSRALLFSCRPRVAAARAIRVDSDVRRLGVADGISRGHCSVD